MKKNMFRFKPYCPDQILLLPPDMKQWLPEGDLAYFLMDVVGELDLSAIYNHYSRSVGWLLKGVPDDPSQPGWGGRYIRAWTRPYSRFKRMTTKADRMEVFGVLELVLPMDDVIPKEPEAVLVVENQRLPGYAASDGTMRFRFCPKSAKVHAFKIESNTPALDGKTGGVTVYLPSSDVAQSPAAGLPNWWTDDPSPNVAEGPHHGAKTISRWREDFLRDFAQRMLRCQSPSSSQSTKRDDRATSFVNTR